jgi:hypothetical protein
MRFLKLFIFISISATLYSCSNEQEDSMEKAVECIEEKYDDGDGQSNFQTIDEAITAYDFESARILLSCYEDTYFANGIRQDEGPYRYISETYKEWYERKAQQNEHFKMLYKIVQAEVTYFLNEGEYSRALASANESDLLPVYKDKLPSAINKWVDEKKYDIVLRVLTIYTFETRFEKEESTSQEYNDEISEFNDMLSSLTNAALLEGNAEVLKKCLLIIKPIAIEDTKGPKYPGGGSQHSILSDKPKQDLISKINEAGISL